MSAAEEVSRLRESAYFSELTITLLEKLVSEEAASEAVYNAKANRGLLKLYGLFPARLSVDNVTLILVKSLTALPEPDFLLASYLLPESYRSSEELALLSELERHLQVGHFGAFWTRAKEEAAQKVLGRVVGVAAAVRVFIAQAIARTYQKIDLVALGVAVDTDDAATFAASQGWAVEGGDAILPLTAENTQRPKQTVGQDGVKYAEISNLIQTLARGA